MGIRNSKVVAESSKDLRVKNYILPIVSPKVTALNEVK